MVIKLATSLIAFIVSGQALAAEPGEKGVEIRGSGNQAAVGNGNAIGKNVHVGALVNGSGAATITNITAELEAPLREFAKQTADALGKLSPPKPITDLAAAKLSLLLDDNPTELQVAKARIGSWVGVDGPSLDITLKNITERTALEIRMAIVGKNGKALSLERPYAGSFRHYSIRGGIQTHVPIARLEEIEEKLGIRAQGYRVVAAGTSPNGLRSDCVIGEFAIGPDMPCRPARPGLTHVTSSGVALRVDYKDIFGGAHYLLTGIYLHMQPVDEAELPIMTFTGD